MKMEKMGFEEFKKKYDSLPNIQELSSEEALNKIWEHEKNVRGIDWLSAEKEGPEGLRKAVLKAQDYIHEQLKKLTPEEIESGKQNKILDSRGKVPDIQKAFFETLADGSPSPATFPDGAPSYTVWGWDEDRVQKYQLARGDDVKKYITNIIRNYQVMEQDDSVGITKLCMGMAISGFGIAGIQATYRIIATLAELTEATEAFAVLEGVMTVGINIIKLGISIVILAILVPLMILMTKDAIGIFIIVNNTYSDMVMTDISFHHGKCVSGFKADAEADNPQAIIPKIFEIYNPNVKQTIKSYSAGFFGVRKRDDALIGTQGAIKFAATTDYPNGVFLGWEVPLAMGDNRLLVSATFTGSVGDFSDKTDDHGVRDSSDTSSANHTVEGHMNSGSGSQAYAFVFIN